MKKYTERISKISLLTRRLLKIFCLERATIAFGKARAKAKILMQSRRCQKPIFEIRSVYLITSFIFFTAFLSGGLSTDVTYHGPTEQLIKRESWERIESKLLKMGIPIELFPYFDSIAANEDWGHIGYHGTNQKFRVFQDIIKFTLQEIVKIEIRDDFHFFRLPGDSDLNLLNKEDFFKYWSKKIDNKSELRSKQLLSLNFGIYSNFDVPGSCSINLFVRDLSKTEIDFKGQLAPFYKELGIDEEALNELFAVGARWLNEDSGVLFQISENSHKYHLHGEAFNLADLFCYPSKKGGFLHGTEPISSHYARILSDTYVASDIDIAPQIRMILSNKYSLNPFSVFTIRRWDLYDEETTAAYESEMRNSIHHLSYDEEKVKAFREKLLNLWTES